MVNVLVVDDSSFVRKAVKSYLEGDPQIKVVGEACDGREAMFMAEQLEPDVITMDLNMPNMDGVTAIEEILKRRQVPILVFTSSSDRDGPRVLEALNAGAVDFISKEAGSSSREEMSNRLRTSVLELGRHEDAMTRRTAFTVTVDDNIRSDVSKPVSRNVLFDVVVIGASTGGPVVIESILKKLSPAFPLPVLIVQHMPAGFTHAFAERLNHLCDIPVYEASDGMPIEAGTVYLAPGGRQMEITGPATNRQIRISDQGRDISYKPCVDVTFRSVAGSYGDKALAIVLTGMGSDGRQGAEQLKQRNATVWAQDRDSSVIYGMPMAVIDARLADKVLSGENIGTRLARFD